MAADAAPICVFPIGGQSNAVGQGGNVSLSPTPPAGVFQFTGGSISALGQTSSLAPAFGTTFFKSTRRRVLFVPVAASGSAQTAALGAFGGFQHWDVGGTLVPAALAAISDAFSAAVSAGYTPRMCGMLWGQGESEGISLVANPGLIDATGYATAFANMVTRFRGVYPDMPVYIIRTGTPVGSSAIYESGFAQIRAAQDKRDGDDNRAKVVSRLASDFGSRGLMYDDFHWNQQGLNEIGDDSARSVISSGLWADF